MWWMCDWQKDKTRKKWAAAVEQKWNEWEGNECKEIYASLYKTWIVSSPVIKEVFGLWKLWLSIYYDVNSKNLLGLTEIDWFAGCWMIMLEVLLILKLDFTFLVMYNSYTSYRSHYNWCISVVMLNKSDLMRIELGSSRSCWFLLFLH